MVGVRFSRAGLLTNALVLLLAAPMVVAEPEFRDLDEATVFVDGDSDYFEFHGGYAANPAAWTIVAPDGSSASIVRTNPTGASPVQRWLLDGTRVAGTSDWTWSGNLDGAAADGTWTLVSVGFYNSVAESNIPGTLSVQGRAIQFDVEAYSPTLMIQTWNWQLGSWTETHAWTDVDSPNEAPQEDPQHARFFAPLPDPVSQSIPGTSQSQTLPSESLDTPPVTTPATCTLAACTAETPVETPEVPIPYTCAPLDLICVGPGGVPAVPITDVPAICDVAGFACIDPETIPGQHLGDTPEVSVAVDFTGLDVLTDPHAGELTTVGPFVVPTPFAPVTVCASTCPFPVPPEGETLGSVTVTVTIDGDTYSETVPLDQTV